MAFEQSEINGDITLLLHSPAAAAALSWTTPTLYECLEVHARTFFDMYLCVPMHATSQAEKVAHEHFLFPPL